MITVKYSYIFQNTDDKLKQMLFEKQYYITFLYSYEIFYFFVMLQQTSMNKSVDEFFCLFALTLSLPHAKTFTSYLNFF